MIRQGKTVNILILVLVILTACIFLVIDARKSYSKTQEQDKYNEIILKYKSTMTFEKLEKMNYVFLRHNNQVADVKVKNFFDSFKKSKVGGYSHPLNFQELVFSDGSSFEIFVVFCILGEKTPGVNVFINYYENGLLKTSTPFVCPELVEWGKEIGIFESYLSSHQ